MATYPGFAMGQPLDYGSTSNWDPRALANVIAMGEPTAPQAPVQPLAPPPTSPMSVVQGMWDKARSPEGLRGLGMLAKYLSNVGQSKNYIPSGNFTKDVLRDIAGGAFGGKAPAAKAPTLSLQTPKATQPTQPGLTLPVIPAGMTGETPADYGDNLFGRPPATSEVDRFRPTEGPTGAGPVAPVTPAPAPVPAQAAPAVSTAPVTEMVQDESGFQTPVLSGNDLRAIAQLVDFPTAAKLYEVGMAHEPQRFAAEAAAATAKAHMLEQERKLRMEPLEQALTYARAQHEMSSADKVAQEAILLRHPEKSRELEQYKAEGTESGKLKAQRLENELFKQTPEGMTPIPPEIRKAIGLNFNTWGELRAFDKNGYSAVMNSYSRIKAAGINAGGMMGAAGINAKMGIGFMNGVLSSVSNLETAKRNWHNSFRDPRGVDPAKLEREKKLSAPGAKPYATPKDLEVLTNIEADLATKKSYLSTVQGAVGEKMGFPFPETVPTEGQRRRGSVPTDATAEITAKYPGASKIKKRPDGKYEFDWNGEHYVQKR